MKSTDEIRSRRSFLGAGVAALAATAVSAIARPSPVHAEGENIQVGEEYTTATSRTRIRNETNAADVFVAEAAGGGTALVGNSSTSTGVAAVSGSGTAIYAFSNSGLGLDVASENGNAVKAQTAAFAGIAVEARANNSSAYALDVSRGRIKLHLSGIATIPAGQKTVTLQFGPNAYAPITAGSFLLISPNANIGTRSLWWTKNGANQTVTIRMSSTRTGPTRVSWLLLG